MDDEDPEQLEQEVGVGGGGGAAVVLRPPRHLGARVVVAEPGQTGEPARAWGAGWLLELQTKAIQKFAKISNSRRRPLQRPTSAFTLKTLC